MMHKKGFVIIIVIAFLAVLILIAWVIVNLGCGEIIQTRAANDMASAYYVARSGAEIMYASLKSREGQTIVWPQSIPSSNSYVKTRDSGGLTIGQFAVTADTSANDVFGIASSGTVNGHTSRVSVLYGFDSPFTNGYPVGCMGSMNMAGSKWFIFRSWVRAEGPLASGGTITTNNFVQVSGALLQNQSFVTPSFWKKYDAGTGVWSDKLTYDSDGDGTRLTDTNGDGTLTVADAGTDVGLQQEFTQDDANHDGVISDADGFYSYYTTELNKQGLNIGEGQSKYYSGSQTFGPWSVPAGTPIIFVNGDVNILYNSTAWWGSSGGHTIVSTGNVTITQPTNGSNDTLSIISYGDVNTGGISVFGGINGNLIVYAGGDFNAFYGGKSNGTIFAKGNVDVDTVLAIPLLLNRNINKSTQDWSDPATWPLGLPPNYNKITLLFRVKNEITQYVPKWQQN